MVKAKKKTEAKTTAAETKKEANAKVTETMIVNRLPAAGFPAAQIEALRDLFKSA